MQIDGLDIQKLNHDTVRIAGKKIIYIDPFKIDGEPQDANIIFITHSHYDHCSIEDIAKVSDENTIIVCVPDCMSKFSKMKVQDIILVEPGKVYDVAGIRVGTMPAYNINKFREAGILFHPKDQEWVGYVITINNKRIYHTGDTDFIEEMKQLQNIDIVFLPISGVYVMTSEEAVQAVSAFKPKLAIPMHYGCIVGTKEDAEKFCSLSSVPTKMLD